MLPNLSALADVGVHASKRGRAAPNVWPQESHLPQEIVDQILDGATTRQKSVLIIYNYTREHEGKCVAPLYATLSFDELQKMGENGSAGAKHLLRAFRDQLDSIDPESRDPINIRIGYNAYEGGFEGLADLLTKNRWPHGLLEERLLPNSNEELDDVETAVELTLALNEQMFQRNRTRLAKLLLENEESYPYADQIPRNPDVDLWWSEFVRRAVYSTMMGGDFQEPFVDEYRPWESLEDVQVQILESWVKNMYQDAGKLLMLKTRDAKQEIPLFVGRIRLTIDGEFGFLPFRSADGLAA